MNKEIEEFRDGIFALNTRRFGKIAELMIKELFNFNESDNLAYDLLAWTGEKIEVKFSTVLIECNSKITSRDIIESVISSKLESRMMSFDEAKKMKFDCNIQQVKTKEFDILYYGCFFSDKIMICKILPYQIEEDSQIFYSDHQHRGNIGEGQFHINNKTIEHHIDNYLERWLTYEELYNIFK